MYTFCEYFLAYYDEVVHHVLRNGISEEKCYQLAGFYWVLLMKTNAILMSECFAVYS